MPSAGADAGAGPRASYARGGALRAARERARALLRLRPPLPDPARSRRDLPRPLQRRRRRCGCRSATWRGCSSTRSRRSPSSTRSRARRRSPSACSAATTTAATARTGSRRRRCGIPRRWHRPIRVSPGEIVSAAKRAGARIVTSTYNEPLITSEWAVAVFKAAKAEGLVCSLRLERQRHPGGARVPAAVGLALQGRPQGLPRPALPRPGRHARARAVRRSGRSTRKGFWVEVVTLVVPGFNDSPEELRDIARFLVVRVARHPVARDRVPPRLPDGRPPATSVQSLLRAAETGAAEGLRFVYAGNLPGRRAELGEHLLPGLPRAARRAAGLQSPAQPARGERSLSRMSAGRGRRLGLSRCARERAERPGWAVQGTERANRRTTNEQTMARTLWTGFRGAERPPCPR